MPDTHTTESLHAQYEPNPDPHALTSPNPDPNERITKTDRPQNVSKDVDYEPHPEQSLKITPAHEKVLNAITSLYSGSASESDMLIYAPHAIYDDPWSYCDTRYKIAGQWYGIPLIFGSSKTLATQVVKADPIGPDHDGAELIWKQRQEYEPKWVEKLGGRGYRADSLVSCVLDGEGRVRFHKDMWNEKDYSHEGLGKVMKTLNGDHLTKVTRPPKSLKDEER